jgi:hypothetical protein
LWTVLTDGDKPKREEANNVYDLPSKPLTINTPPPRLETSIDKTSILNMPPPRVVESSKADSKKIMLNPNRNKL